MWLSTLSRELEAHQAAADANRRRASARSTKLVADAGAGANAPAADAGAAAPDGAAAAAGEPVRIKVYKRDVSAKLGARRTGPRTRPEPLELLRAYSRTLASSARTCRLHPPSPAPPAPAHPAPARTALSPLHAAPPSPHRPPSPH